MNQFASVEGLNGIEFKVYNVSTEFYAQITAGKTVEEAQALIATTDVSSKTAEATGTTATVGLEDGYLSFNLESLVNGKHAVYLIVETPKAGVDRAANMVVAFPVYEITGTSNGKLLYGNTELQTIHLYPKNVVIRGSLEVEKKSTITGASVDGAKFVIHRNGLYGAVGTEYYKELKNDGIVDWTTNEALAQEFTITNGKFLAEGLEFGNYYFTETVTPTNHSIINAQTLNHSFTIDETTTDVSLTGENAVLNDGIKVDKETTRNTNDGYDYNIGESIPYTITVPIPLGIADKLSDDTYRHKKFELTDTHDAQLTFENTGYELKADGITISNTAYTITPETNGFTVKLNDGFQTLLDGRSELVFTYNMDINETAVLQESYDNSVSVFTSFSTATDTADPVVTYGKRFIKVDADNEDQALAGATFIVRSADSDTADYLKQTLDSGKVKKSEWTATSSERREFVTDATGVIDIVGLKAGDYWLEEVTAPDGYVKLSNRVKFTIDANGYYDGETVLTTDVVNKHKGTLPLTGGMGIYVVISAGIVAMVGSGIWYLKRKPI